MHVSRLQLEEFRAYRHLETALPSVGCRLVGCNASGKTTLLEALVVLATTRSPRTQADRELINWASGEAYGVPPYTRLSAQNHAGTTWQEVQIGLQVDPQHRAGTRKSFLLDGRSVRAHDLVGSIKVVLFSPEDLGLVIGPPSIRRRHVDVLLSQLDREYLRALSRFNRLVSQRNGLLKTLVRDKVDARSTAAAIQLAFWDERLVAEGSYLTAQRLRAIQHLSDVVAERASELIEGGTLTLRYEPSLELGAVAEDARETGDIVALASRVAAIYERQLSAVRVEEFRRGVSLVGPHRDDVGLEIEERSLARFGSRGQQRLAVVALKLAEAALIRQQTGDLPILLLDDVLSELDEQHRVRLVQEVTQPGCQLFVTAASTEALDAPALAQLPLARVEAGTIAFN